jgi:RNA polymerase sigma-70 factor, ECF subfamily
LTEIYARRNFWRVHLQNEMPVRMQQSDEELFRLMRKGNQQAFAELYERREPGLYRYALYMCGSETIAEETAHEVFVQLMNARMNFDDQRGTLEGWMFGVARNLVRAALRKSRVEEPVDQAVEDDILGGIISSEASELVRNAVRDLPPRYREVVVLCDLEERSYEGASQFIGCPVGTVRSRLHRARALLAQKLKRLRAPAAAGAL